MKKEKSVRNAELKRAILDRVKSLIVPVILLTIILVGVFVVINYKSEEEAEPIIKVNGYDGGKDPIVVQNDKLKLTMDPTTTQFAVEVKGTDKIWYSNPLDADADPIAQSTEKKNLQSTVLLVTSQSSGKLTEYNSFQYSVEKGLYEIEAASDSIRVKYSIGKIEREYICPPVLTVDEYKEWMEKMDATGQKDLKAFYVFYDIKKLDKNKQKDQLLEMYPMLNEQSIYAVPPTSRSAVYTKLETAFENAGYTLEQFEEDKKRRAGGGDNDSPVFNVEVIYKLDGNDLVVSVPMKSLEFSKTYPILTLSVLPYFGAGSTQDDGFLLIPEGGGAQIDFNNGKVNQSGYEANMYGWDMALPRKDIVHNTRAYFNAFGISHEDGSFLCILEEGAPYAAVKADIAGKPGAAGTKLNSYNTAKAVYNICAREEYDVGDIANTKVFVYKTDLPDETLTQRYCLLEGSDYTDMAKEYKQYLMDTYPGALTTKQQDSAPITLEIVGAVDKVKQILGVPVSKPLELTTFEEAQEMIEELYGEGFKNMTVKLTGWCNGGVNQKILKSAKVVSALGSKKDLQKLSDKASELGIDFYLEGVTQYAYDSGITNGFFSYADAAKTIAKERAQIPVYSAITYSKREGVDDYYLLHPDLIDKLTQNLVDATQKYNAGIAFRETGMDLSSDFYKKNTVSRQQAMDRQVATLKTIADSNQKIMINMGNAYAAVYSDSITNMDLKGTRYTLIDRHVPFYQMVLHGYVDYSGEPLNLAGEFEEELLRSAEYGAGLQFSLMKESTFTLQKTLYTEYYGADYDAIHDKMVAVYDRYNKELGHTFKQEMTGHVACTANVTCTEYADGTKVYVNYGFEDAEVDGVRIPSRDYKVTK